uniref:Serine/threonine-protein kinase RIO1 n=1 Tax=Kwoniella bestiolae CBS 10118 TaxID=1296100 RepID=A0A1B9FZV7_9TREE|nr:Atypical/RIO/RIO1 protein kinase [Kwoniella bestiolae CBS 10118]OCF24308.1 Atypical/RIO/RIO1 protein kinase [Kwoniella bestiolae CBS 10118]
MSRNSTAGYIDQSENDVAAQAAQVDSEVSHQFDDAQSSGSSMEEESDEGVPFDDLSVSDDQFDQNIGGLEDGDLDEESGDWDVDDEDWELANGDFTKQYNRVRQQHAATTGSAPLPARNAPSQASSSKTSKTNPFASVGVAMNPKVAHEKQDKDKSDRATQDQVLDSRTRLVLAGLVNRNLIGKIERCVSTGKEANVYYALPGVAVKIYRTSILNFRSRSNYIVGEQRFKGEYTSSKNPRKMVRVWAEKELRNLRRLVQGGIRAPKVFDCKENVLVMEFLGDGDNSASPRLKDAQVEADRLDALYAELVIAARRMYQHCHLVHADLSEYNILLHEGHLWIIDVSQSVEHDHPKAFDFLRADLQNVEDFFERRGVKCLGLRRAWEFVVTENVGLSPEEELSTGGDDKLTAIVTEWLSQPSNKTDDAVFMSSYIPRTLAEVYDPERDVDLLKRGGGDDLIYAGITGLKLAEKTERKEVKEVRFEDAPAEEEVAESNWEAEDEPHKPRGFRHEDKDAKKERKKALKEENREKRKNKMPKAEKQRLIKKSQK